MPDREEKIRARAYSLWERGGYAHGSHEQHWAEAERQIDAEEAEASAGPGDTVRPAGGSTSEAPNTEAPAEPVAAKRRPKGGSAAAPAEARKPRARTSKSP